MRDTTVYERGCQISWDAKYTVTPGVVVIIHRQCGSLSPCIPSLVLLSHLVLELQSVKSKIQTQLCSDKFYVLSDAAPCCFSEATLSEFSATSGSSMSLLLHARFALSQLLQALRGVIECQPGLVIFNRTVGFSIPLVWTPPTAFQGYDTGFRGMCRSSETQR